MIHQHEGPLRKKFKPGLTGQNNIVARDSTIYTFILKTSGKKIKLFVQSHCQCSHLFVPPGAGIDGIVGDSPGTQQGCDFKMFRVYVLSSFYPILILLRD